MGQLSYGRAISERARQDPDRVAVVFEGTSLSRGELERRSNRMAHAFLERGVEPGRLVTIGLPNGLEFVVACVAAWKCGAVPNPISPRLPVRERDAILDLADPALVIGFDDFADRANALRGDFEPPPGLAETPPPDVVAPNERAMATGGSTGHPKLILLRTPAVCDPDAPATLLSPDGCVLVPGPLYHAAPFGSLTQALLSPHETILMRRFDASECLALVERHRVSQILFVPTMMHRIWRLPETERMARDVSSLRMVLTGGAPCPAWLMRCFIEWLGPGVMHEVYGGSERIGGTFITGHEWLEHPGSVGRPLPTSRIRILDPDTGRELPTGEVGEIYMMPMGGPGSTYRYLGADARATDDGWESVGDMGWLDADGYLHLADRRTDMILSGGRNVYPAHVESAIDEHPAVASSAVIGLPDEDLGQRVHAIVQTNRAVSEIELRAHLEPRVIHYAMPRSYEFVDQPLRDEAGKLRRFALRAERVSS